MAELARSILAEDLDNEVHIWRTFLDLSSAAFEMAVASISDDEIGRAQRFKFQKDRRRFIAARAFLRRTLAGYLSVAPSELEFGYGRYGKPELLPSSHSHAMEFNLSHSGELVLLAVTRGRRVGIDVESIDHRSDLRTIAPHFFSARENAALEEMSAEHRDLGFFRGWTRKEAFLKALGHGLAFPLDAFDVSLSGAPGLLRFRDDKEAPSKWTLCHLDPEPGYVAALAIEGRGIQAVWKSGRGAQGSSVDRGVDRCARLLVVGSALMSDLSGE